MFIPFLVAKVFHIFKKSKNLKNVKRLYPRKKNKRVKRIKYGQKMKENEPQQKERQGKCASVNATTVYFCIIKNCVQFVTYATICE